MEAGFSKAEIQEQVDAGALNTAEEAARRQRLRVGEGRADAEELRQVVLHGGFVVRFLAPRKASAVNAVGGRNAGSARESRTRLLADGNSGELLSR